MSDPSEMLLAIKQAEEVIANLGPQPERIEMTPANFTALREYCDFQEWEREVHAPHWAPRVDGPGMGWAFTGVPVIVNKDLPAPGYKIIYSDGTERP